MLLIILTGRSLNSREKCFLIECEMIWSRVCHRSISSSLQQIKLYSFSHLHSQLGFLVCRVATWPTFRSPKPSKRDKPHNDDFQMSPFLTNQLSSRIQQISPSAGRTLNVIPNSAVPSLMRAATQPTCSPDHPCNKLFVRSHECQPWRRSLHRCPLSVRSVSDSEMQNYKAGLYQLLLIYKFLLKKLKTSKF